VKKIGKLEVTSKHSDLQEVKIRITAFPIKKEPDPGADVQAGLGPSA